MAKKTTRLATSGKTTATQVVGGTQNFKLPAKHHEALVSGVSAHFGRMWPDASPGWNTLTISNLPAGTRAVSVWMTEWSAGDKSHAGSAWFKTDSVQLYANGTKCRVRFHLQWHKHLPTGLQLIYG